MKTKEVKNYSNVTCPNCGSSNVTQVADHGSKGYNGYVCKDCGLQWGN